MKLAPKIQIGPVGGGTSKPLKVTVQTSPSICDCWSHKEKYVVSCRPVLNNNPSFKIVLEHKHQSKGHVFPLTCNDIHPSRQFWCELLRFGEGYRDVCLLSDIMLLNDTRLLVLRENTIKNSTETLPRNHDPVTQAIHRPCCEQFFEELFSHYHCAEGR